MGREHVHGSHDGELPAERPRVLVFFDYACPFCYVDMHRFESLEADMDFEMVLVPFELRPEMSEPIDLASEGTGHSERVDDYLDRIAEKEEFAFTQPRLLPNTHRAIVLGEVGRDRGDPVHRSVHRAIFGAYFAEERDIDSDEVLFDIAAGAGIEPGELEAAWSDETYDERIHEFRHLALHIGLDATPAAVICNELVVGSRPVKVLRQALERCDARLEAAREGVLEDAGEPPDPRIEVSPASQRTDAAPKR